MEAHQRVLDALPQDDDRREAFRQTEIRWRKTGQALGAAATALDFSLAGVGFWLMLKGLRQPENALFNTFRPIYDLSGQIDMRHHRKHIKGKTTGTEIYLRRLLDQAWEKVFPLTFAITKIFIIISFNILFFRTLTGTF